MDLKDLEMKRAHLTVEWSGFTVNLEYRPDLVTGETQRALFTLGDTGDPSPFYAELVRIVTAWDITANDEPVPLIVDQMIGVVPLPMVGRILGGILGDVGAPKNVTSLPSGSNLVEPSASVPTGQASSSTLNGQESHPGSLLQYPTHEPASVGEAG